MNRLVEMDNQKVSRKFGLSCLVFELESKNQMFLFITNIIILLHIISV